jgi:alpha-beta hydrolase superfamily lysophospholipase
MDKANLLGVSTVPLQSVPPARSLPIYIVPATATANPYFCGNTEVPDRFEGQKEQKVPWIYTPLIKLVSYLYLHPNTVQQFLPNFLSPYMPYKTFKKIAKCEELSFKSSDGVALKGYWLPSKNPASKETIILGHGYFANATTLYPLAKEFTDKGINVFLFDFRAHGQSARSKATLGFHEGKDILAAVTTVKERFPNHAETLHYLGHSMGAAALMLTPKSLGETEINSLNQSLNGKIILDSPFAYLRLKDNPFITQFSSYQPKSKMLSWLWRPIQPAVSHIVQKMAIGFEDRSQKEMDLPTSLKELKPAEIFKQSSLNQKPILLLHGKQDTRTDYAQGEDIHRTLSSCNQRIQFVSLNSDHVANDFQIEGKGKGYKTVLRDKDNYLNAVGQFLSEV